MNDTSQNNNVVVPPGDNSTAPLVPAGNDVVHSRSRKDGLRRPGLI